MDPEVRSKVELVRKTGNTLKPVLWNDAIPKENRRRILHAMWRLY